MQSWLSPYMILLFSFEVTQRHMLSWGLKSFMIFLFRFYWTEAFEMLVFLRHPILFEFAFEVTQRHMLWWGLKSFMTFLFRFYWTEAFEMLDFLRHPILFEYKNATLSSTLNCTSQIWSYFPLSWVFLAIHITHRMNWTQRGKKVNHMPNDLFWTLHSFVVSHKSLMNPRVMHV